MSTYSSNLKIELIGTGEQTGTWGTTTNSNFSNVFEQSIVGRVTVNFATDANKTLSASDSVSSQDFRNVYLNLTSSGSLTATRELIVPTINKNYIIQNNTTGGQSITVKTSAGTGITVVNGATCPVYADGTNVIAGFNYLPSLTLGTALALASGGTGSATASGARTNLGATTLGGNLFTITNPSAVTFPRFNADNTVSALSASDFRTAIGAGTGAGTVTSVTGTSPVASSGGTTPAISLESGYGDTQNPYASKTANYFLAAPNGSSGAPTFRAIVAADIPTLNQNTTGTAAGLSSTLGVASGGTGKTSLTANNVLLGNGTSAVQEVAPSTAGNVLASNGTTWVSTTFAAFPSGTKMFFAQTSAPTGWTKSTAYDQHAIRIVSGTASSGGVVNFTTAFSAQVPSGSLSLNVGSLSIGSTTLTTTQIPAHSHGYYYPEFANGVQSGSDFVTVSGSSLNGTTDAGSGGSHSHSISGSPSGTFTGSTMNLDVKYIDAILATKD